MIHGISLSLPIAMTQQDREDAQTGDLPLDRLREIAGDAITYSVTRVPSPALAVYAARGAERSTSSEVTRRLMIELRKSNLTDEQQKDSLLRRYDPDRQGICSVDFSQDGVMRLMGLIETGFVYADDLVESLIRG